MSFEHKSDCKGVRDQRGGERGASQCRLLIGKERREWCGRGYSC